MVKVSILSFASALVTYTGMVAADHWITVVNNCGVTANPWVADTSCTYSAARCGQTNAYTGPTSYTVAPGGSAIFMLPNNFVGRVFDKGSSSACGTDGWDCSLLEFNFDNGAAATDQSYDLSNIQGFTRGMQAVPWPSNAGCQTKTCFASNCALDQAYPPGNEGDNAANTSCGAANLGITLYLCAA
ncbi:hypothetical protein FRB96_008047 [Tulasnella sp. 330]|nr:hypothetical protein FRB96_008047 [Tulasnella sp. 330]KAG8874717.1 hypothetical protein FRB97_005691 [Tulasnella sp. 331]KAG8882246.1 hypothetical protein FRB98_003850 [Tulasnella sp. 332]